MYYDLVEEITTRDREALAALGVPSSRVSEWKHGNRLPTRSQAMALATVKGVDPHKLEQELSMIEIEKDATKTKGSQHYLNAYANCNDRP